MDGLMGRYHIRAKSRDAMVRLFYHFIDMAATNAYILYRRMHAEMHAERCNDSSLEVPPPKPKLFELPEFREKIAAGLVSFVPKRSVGRPTSRPSTPTTPPPVAPPCSLKPGQRSKHPVEDIRYDGLDHYAIMLTNQEKRFCKLCKTSKTQFFCEKCRLHLCITNQKNCFKSYHSNT